MNKQLQHKLNKTAEICQQMLDGKKFSVSGSELDCVPVSVATKTAMDKKGFELKRGAKPVGSWSFYHSRGGWIRAELYLKTSFKPKPIQEKQKNKPSLKTPDKAIASEIPVFIPNVKPIEYEFLRIQCCIQANKYKLLRSKAVFSGKIFEKAHWERSIDEIKRLEKFFAQIVEKCGGLA